MMIRMDAGGPRTICSESRSREGSGSGSLGDRSSLGLMPQVHGPLLIAQYSPDGACIFASPSGQHEGSCSISGTVCDAQLVAQSCPVPPGSAIPEAWSTPIENKMRVSQRVMGRNSLTKQLFLFNNLVHGIIPGE